MLNKGERAPFNGVLVGDERYRYYQTRDVEATLYENRFLEDNRDHHASDPLGVGVAGFVTGVLASVLVFSMVKH